MLIATANHVRARPSARLRSRCARFEIPSDEREGGAGELPRRLEPFTAEGCRAIPRPPLPIVGRPLRGAGFLLAAWSSCAMGKNGALLHPAGWSAGELLRGFLAGPACFEEGPEISRRTNRVDAVLPPRADHLISRAASSRRFSPRPKRCLCHGTPRSAFLLFPSRPVKGTTSHVPYLAEVCRRGSGGPPAARSFRRPSARRLIPVVIRRPAPGLWDRRRGASLAGRAPARPGARVDARRVRQRGRAGGPRTAGFLRERPWGRNRRPATWSSAFSGLE